MSTRPHETDRPLEIDPPIDVDSDIPRIDPLEIERMLKINTGLSYYQERTAMRFFLDDMRQRWPNVFGEVFVRSLVQFEYLHDHQRLGHDPLILESEHGPATSLGSGNVNEPLAVAPVDAG